MANWSNLSSATKWMLDEISLLLLSVLECAVVLCPSTRCIELDQKDQISDTRSNDLKGGHPDNYKSGPDVCPETHKHMDQNPLTEYNRLQSKLKSPHDRTGVRWSNCCEKLRNWIRISQVEAEVRVNCGLLWNKVHFIVIVTSHSSTMRASHCSFSTSWAPTYLRNRLWTLATINDFM